MRECQEEAGVRVSGGSWCERVSGGSWCERVSGGS